MKNPTKKINYKENLLEYLGFLKKYKLILVILLIVALIAETRNILNTYLFKIIIDKGTEYTSGIILSEAFTHILIIVASVFLASTFLSFIMNWARIYFLNKLDAGVIIDLKQKYFSHIISLDHNFHTTHKTGSLISKLSRGSSAIERMNDTIIFEFAPLVIQVAIVVSALLYLDKFSAFVILGVMAVFVLFNVYRQRISEPSNVIANKTEDIEKGRMADFLTNIDSIRYFGKEDYVRRIYRSISLKTKTNSLKHWRLYEITSASQGLILGLGTFLLVYFSLMKFLNGGMTLGTLAFIYTTYLGLIGPLFSFVHGIRNLSRATADMQELFEYGKIESAIKDKPNAKTAKIIRGEIEFKNVDFNYGKRKIFENFNLKVPQNKKIALVGHSGCGKTTLIKLLYRLYSVDSGEILIDKENIENFKQQSLRAEMSIVPQEPILFDDTIFNNIKFSNPEASREDVIKAMRFAHLDKIIQNFPNKENTIVGERGVKLSGGEKQRVGIARAILADRKILVLDEATSSLDSETEYEIQRDLARLMEGRTSIIIAHRLSTIMHADIIVVMKKGKIVQSGSHAHLIHEGGEYQKLWNLQRGGYLKEKPSSILEKVK